MKIKSINELKELRQSKQQKYVQIDFDDRIFTGNLPMYIVKYGIWALRPGGILELNCQKLVDSMVFTPYRLPFQLFVQIVGKVSDGLAVLNHVDLSTRRIILQKNLLKSSVPRWSAGVIFSGNEKEIPLLESCIKGLLNQDELKESKDIVICGPPHGKDLIPTCDGIRYLEYPTPVEDNRFLICKKKNFLLNHLLNEKVLICHSRITLRPKALASLPESFDLITPRVFVKGHKNNSLPYLDLGFMSLDMTNMMSKGEQPPIDYNRDRWHYYLRSYYPYIDGGLFCIRKNLGQSVPLHDQIAWGEGEDTEWCLRLIHNGYLVELSDNELASADSLTCKTTKYANYGHLRIYRIARSFWRLVRTCMYYLFSFI